MSPGARYRLAATLTALSFGCGLLALLAFEYTIAHLFEPGVELLSAFVWLCPVGFVMAVIGAILLPPGHIRLRVANTLLLLAFVGVVLFYEAISFFHPGVV